MSSLAVIFWIVTVFIDTVGHVLFKVAACKSAHIDGVAHWKDMFMRPWIWLGASCYVLEFVAWLAFLSLVELSEGVMLGSINIVVLMVAGRLWFNEKLTTWRLVGILLITLGVIVVGVGS